MPPDRTAASGSSKPKTNKPFKPPRASGASTTASSSRTKPTSHPARQSAATGASSSSSRPRASTSTNIDPYDIPDTSAMTAAAADDDAEEPRARIPPELLTRLLHEFFTDDKMRISKGADRAVGKYMETFVREAIARAAFERESAGSGAALGGKFMEVEDLEKLAPQLVLDF